MNSSIKPIFIVSAISGAILITSALSILKYKMKQQRKAVQIRKQQEGNIRPKYHKCYQSKHKQKFLLENEKYNSIQSVLKQFYKLIKQKYSVIERLYDVKSKEILLQPFLHTIKGNGKQIRLILALIIAEMYCCQCYRNSINKKSGEVLKEYEDVIYKIGGLIECLHSASIMIDDFQDCSRKRRGQKCAYLMFGQDIAVNSANTMYFLPVCQVLRSLAFGHQKQEFVRAYVEMMADCHLGQAQQMTMHRMVDKQQFNRLYPDENTYYRITSGKTVALLKGMVQFLAVGLIIPDEQGNYQKLISDKQLTILEQIVQKVGIGFQIRDDLLNLQGNSSKSKGLVGEDLFEKKFTLVIHFLRDNDRFMELFLKDRDNQNRVYEDIDMNQANNSQIEEMISIVNQSQVKQKIKEIANNFIQEAISLVDNLQTPNSKQSFKKIIQFVVQRNK